VADSLAGLAVADLTGARRIADVGAGAGFPGLPIAAALPDASVDLLESTWRKCEVIERLIGAAGLENARAVAARAEDWAAAEGAAAYDAVTARALAPLAIVIEYAAPLLREAGALVAWKGDRDELEERAGAAAAEQLGLKLAKVVPVTPFEGSERRHLHVFTKVAPTPPRFPRRAGMAKKRPLA
jgi:16S rRNA (guanine527-N7)-methyltransferase